MSSSFNVLICGTPGTGKSTLVDRIKAKEELGACGRQFSFINLSKFAIDNECTCGYDDKLESHFIDEDKLLDKLKPVLDTNNCSIVESIEADLLPPDLFHLVFVCRTDNTILYDRLKLRNYNEAKISENISAEIFQTILDAARESFEPSKIKVHEIMNDQEEEIEKNVEFIVREVNDGLSKRI